MAGGFLFEEKKKNSFFSYGIRRRREDEVRFQYLAEQWLENVKFRVKESSYVKYYNLVYNHIIPSLGNIFISDFTTRVIENFIEEKLKNGKKNGKGGLAAKTVKDILVVIKEICFFAEEYNIKLPCRLETIKIRFREPEICIMDKQDQHKLEEFLIRDDSLYKTGILLSLYMGLRLGEVCALQRKHIYFHTEILQIRKTMQRIQTLDQTGGKKTKIIVTEPKTISSIRDIPIPGFLLKRLAILENASPQAYILTGSPYRYMEPRMLEHHFKSCLQQCEIKVVSYHTLRHTFATRCVEVGFDVKSLSEILGHSNVNITLNRYVHSSMEQKRRNMELLQMAEENNDCKTEETIF